MKFSKEIKELWQSTMDGSSNPLKTYPLPTVHLIMQLLAWMWSVIFSVAIGSYLAFGISAVGHALMIAGVFVTMLVFNEASSRKSKD